MNSFAKNLLDFFLPSFCSHCRSKLNTNERFICSECFSKIKLADDARIASEYNRKFGDKALVSGFITHFIFEKDRELQSLIHSLKYQNKFLAGVYLGSILAGANEEFFKDKKISLIVPVPLHRLKKAERGYNQAYYIARGVSRQTKIPFGGKILMRVKYTQTQTKLDLKEREQNVRDAFRKRKLRDVKGKNILIIDDVITTGATTNECGKVLLEADANKIYAGSIALAD